MSPWRVIDLFAGIGGFHYAFERAGAEIVFASEIDRFARQAYEANHRASSPELFDGGHFAGDIREVKSDEVPSFDIIAGGFPCQAFSLAGVSKNNSLGRAHGFDDTRGTLFFEIARLIRDHQPAAFLLENVKNLMSHDKGRTFEVIRSAITEDLGYQLDYRVISSETLTPQRRQRVFLVGFREPTEWVWPEWDDAGLRLGDIMERDVDPKYTLSDKLWNYLQSHAKKSADAGKGFGFGLVGPDDITRTISARYGKDGSEILIAQPGKNPRRLTPREALRLQGFPDSHEIVCSDSQTYKQAGNAVAVPVVEQLARQVVATLDKAAWAKPVGEQVPAR
jgi:DNA (cytosine-5)-methyltransferase 1